MNSIILVEDSEVISDLKILNHMLHNMKAKVGNTIKVTRINRDRQLAQILEIDDKQCRLKYLKSEPSSEPWFELIVGVSRPQTMKKILEHGTTYGAKNFHFYQAALSEKSYLDAKIFESENSKDHIHLGLSQSAIYFREPRVLQYKYNPALKFESNDQKFILDLEGDHSFLDFEIDFKKPIILSVGPERGFIAEDLNQFKSAGFKSVKVSASVLRVEHATYSAISQLELLKKWRNKND